MRLLLFTLLCLVTILILRLIRRGSRSDARAGRPGEKPEEPPAREDEIVDVRFEDVSADGKTPKGAP